MAHYSENLEEIKQQYFFPAYSVLVSQRYSWQNPPKSWIPGINVGADLTDDIKERINEEIFDLEKFHNYYIFGPENFITKYGQEAYDNRILINDEIANIILNENIGQNLMNAAEAKLSAAFDEATSVADKYNLEFSIYPAYGMGGTYDGESGEWSSSSASC